MKFRWAWFLFCVVLGPVLLIAGLLVPAHFRGLDAGVARSAGQNSSSLLEDGQMLAGGKRLGAAALILAAARLENIPGRAQFGADLTNLARQYPTAVFWGADVDTGKVFGSRFHPADQNRNLADFLIRRENRDAALDHLQNSPNVAVRELLQTRSINQLAVFSPSASAAGQAYDAAVAMTGLLLAEGRLSPGLRDDVYNLASAANHGDGARPLEEVLLDVTSLAERFNWDQLTAFAGPIPNAPVLHQLTEKVRIASERLPVLFAAVQLSGEPAGVAGYLDKFPNTGLADLGAALHYRAGGINEMTRRQQRLFALGFERTVTTHEPLNGYFYLAAKESVRHPAAALAGKLFIYLLAGFFLAMALHVALDGTGVPQPVRGFHVLREMLFALGFLLVVLILTEPFLSQDLQKETFTLRLLPPAVGGAFPAVASRIKQTPMNPTIILTLLVFFVLQALIYLSCLLKLAEIRRQNVPARIKLKLLENEDHLFDAGLYLGFVGTIASLIIASLGLVKFSLMAAYSSTSFGIIFVVIFKIFHLRPARRALLMEAEADSVFAARAAVPAPPTALPS